MAPRLECHGGPGPGRPPVGQAGTPSARPSGGPAAPPGRRPAAGSDAPTRPTGRAGDPLPGRGLLQRARALLPPELSAGQTPAFGGEKDGPLD
jgi:hypothetical protein